jgi:TolA-binding protein
MSSNRLYSLFQSFHLHRKDIESYGKTKDTLQKNSVEQKAASNSFDSDAFEGWEENSFNTELMQNLDSKFIHKPKINFIKGISLTVILGTMVSLLFLYNINHDQELTDKSVKNTDLTSSMMVDESDIILPQTIEEMNNAPIHKQIKPKKIKSDFAEMKTIEEEIKSNQEVDQLPIKEFKPEKEKALITNKKNAKEIYLNDLKLIDYSAYRSNPTVKTKQVLLTGTPANKESDESEEVEATWRTVDIPYNDYIDKSLRILNGGNYKKALSRFETILKVYPDDINSIFYSGFCLYNLGEYYTAIENFQKCMSGEFNNFDEEAEWMMAQAYVMNGNKTKAIDVFKSIIEENGYYAKQAKVKISQ